MAYGCWSSALPRALSTTAAYLAKLNAEQRRAVEHGSGSLEEALPLLIIAGAGSGKTNTLAHRVAHLIVAGVDPRRMMLLTFSRRAAAEMQRACRAYRRSGAGRESRRDDGRAKLVGNVSCDWCAAPT